MFSDGDHLFLSPEVLSITNSALTGPVVPNFEGISPFIHNNTVYDLIKIECLAETSVQTITSSSNSPGIQFSLNSNVNPVESKFMFALPCPPEWNPAYSHIINFVHGSESKKEQIAQGT